MYAMMSSGRLYMCVLMISLGAAAEMEFGFVLLKWFSSLSRLMLSQYMMGNNHLMLSKFKMWQQEMGISASAAAHRSVSAAAHRRSMMSDRRRLGLRVVMLYHSIVKTCV